MLIALGFANFFLSILMEKKSHRSNESERVGFLDKQFMLKLFIIPVQFKLSDKRLT